ncbi:MAG TPA: hypothetical protein PKD66_10840 [Azonexus sp.]|nr:hypothetical protein [Azonexus sp.]
MKKDRWTGRELPGRSSELTACMPILPTFDDYFKNGGIFQWTVALAAVVMAAGIARSQLLILPVAVA